MILESKLTGKQSRVTKEQWEEMRKRGDSTNFKVIDRTDTPEFINVTEVKPPKFIPKVTATFAEPKPEPEKPKRKRLQTTKKQKQND